MSACHDCVVIGVAFVVLGNHQIPLAFIARPAETFNHFLYNRRGPMAYPETGSLVSGKGGYPWTGARIQQTDIQQLA
jgi:hypothetical protein